MHSEDNIVTNEVSSYGGIEEVPVSLNGSFPEDLQRSIEDEFESSIAHIEDDSQVMDQDTVSPFIKRGREYDDLVESEEEIQEEEIRRFKIKATIVPEKIDPNAVSNFQLNSGNHYKLSSGNFLLGMYTGERLSFIGGTKLIPLVGSVEVMGYRISSPLGSIKGLNCIPIIGELNKSANNVQHPFNLSRLTLKQYTCYSSLTHSILNIEAVTMGTDTKQLGPIKGSKNIGLLPFSVFHKANSLDLGQKADFSDTQKELRELLALEIPHFFANAISVGLAKPFDSLVLVSDATSTHYRRFQGSRGFQTEHHLQGMFTPPFTKPLFPGFYPIMEAKNGVTAFQTPKIWTTNCQAFVQSAFGYVQGDTSLYPTALVCGPKNTGKSTFSKFLVNQLLEKFPAVAFINCDIGQTELTPPGVLALHFLTEPILGPPFTQLRTPIHACYMGETHPTNCTSHFFDSVTHFLNLVQGQAHPFFTTSRSPIPIVVNTSGWYKGDGRNFLFKIVQMISPSHLFQLGQGEVIASGAICLPTPSSGFSSVQSRITSEQHRTLALASHLLSDPSGWCLDTPLTFRIPKLIPWSQVEFWVLSGDLDLSQTLYAFNGAVVGLYISPTLSIPKSQGVQPPRLVKPQIAKFPPPAHYNCVGLALIRGIDRSKGMLHLITPLADEVLANVAAIAKGEQSLPRQLMALPHH